MSTSNGNGSATTTAAVTAHAAHTAVVSAETKKRINALRNIQLQLFDVEADFYTELHKLEAKFAERYEPLYDQRAAIVTGKREPTEVEATWSYDSEHGHDNEAAAAEADQAAKSSPAKGLPGFWLDTFKSTNILLDVIQEHDEPILEKLQDVRVKLDPTQPLSYTLEFHFAPNDYFRNAVLTKTFELTTERDKQHPFERENVSLYRCLGCTIDWHEGKDVTVRVTKKKKKANGSNDNDSEPSSRSVAEEERLESFFDFFKTHTKDGVRPPLVCGHAHKLEGKDDDDAKEEALSKLGQQLEIEKQLEMDFELGQFIKQNIVLRAALYYTGELGEPMVPFGEDDDDDEDDEDDDDEDDDDDDDEDDDDEDDDDEEEAKKNTKKAGSNPQKKSKPSASK